MSSVFGFRRAITPAQLRRRYLLALSLIALLICSSQGGMQYLFSTQQADSHVVNLAGRQRMLSQKIAKSSTNLMRNQRQAYRRHHDELKEALALWQRTHIGLRAGDPSLMLPGNNSPEVSALFDQLEPSFQALVESVEQLLVGHEDHALLEAALKTIQLNEADFLQGMNQIVFRYEEEAEQRVAFIRWLELALFVVTLLVLALEARYIFAPAIQRVEETLDDMYRSHEGLKRLFAASPTGLMLLDAKTLTLFEGNSRMRELLAMDLLEGESPPLEYYLDPVHSVNREFIDKLREQSTQGDFEVDLVNARRVTLNMLASIRSCTFKDRRMLIVGLTDVSEIRQAQKLIEYYASYDELTGLVNRRTGLQMLDKAFHNAVRFGENLTLCYIDLDGLKAANDSLGHSEGDWMIKTLCAEFIRSVRACDVVARIGGDEFILLLPRCTHADGVTLMERIEAELKIIQQRERKPYSLGFSYGVVQYDVNHHSSASELMNDGDQRMYRAKREKER